MEERSDSLDERLKALMVIACQYPLETDADGKVKKPHIKRQRALAEITRLVTPKLWRESAPYYADALHQVWLYLYQKPEQYDPERASVITWLNNRLKYKLLDLKHKWLEEKKRYTSLSMDDGQEMDLVDGKATNELDLPNLVEAIRAWAQGYAAGELQAEHVRKRPEINSQRLILDRLPQEVEWARLATVLDSSVPTLSAHYQRKCIPRLQKFCEDQGYS
jgi:hypothetical protein